MTPNQNNQISHAEAMGMNRATRRKLAKLNNVPVIPASSKPYVKKKEGDPYALQTFTGKKI